MEPHPDRAAPADQVTTLHVQRALGGDAASLAWVVERLTPLLRCHAHYRLGPGLRRVIEPDDLVQDAWLVALPRLRDLCRGDRRRTPVLLRFLSRTIVNRIHNVARRHLRSAPDGVDAAAIDPDRLPAETTGVVTRAIRAEQRSAVADCIAQLEDKDREIVLLRGVEQMPNRTVAALLGITPGAAAMRYQRALAVLRGRLPDSVFDELRGR